MTDPKRQFPDSHQAVADTEVRIEDPALQALLAYWQGLCRDGALPGRGDIVPSRIKALLPIVMLVDVVGSPPRFRWRLLGTAITQVMGRDSTGKWFDELYSEGVLARMNEIYGLSAARRAPVRYTGSFDLVGKDHVPFESLHLPLVDEDGRVVMLMVGMQPCLPQ